MIVFISSNYKIKKFLWFKWFSGDRVAIADSYLPDVQVHGLQLTLGLIRNEKPEAVYCDSLTTQLLLEKHGIKAANIESIKQVAFSIQGTTEYKEKDGFRGTYKLDNITEGQVKGRVVEDPDKVTELGTPSALIIEDCINHKKVNMKYLLNKHLDFGNLGLSNRAKRLRDIHNLIVERTTL